MSDQQIWTCSFRGRAGASANASFPSRVRAVAFAERHAGPMDWSFNWAEDVDGMWLLVTPTVVTASETDRVRVGMLAPVAWRVPPVHCGPWERVVSILPEGLVARGVDGTLFATADSTTRAAGRSRAARLCRRPIAGRQGVRVSAPLRLSSTPRRARSTSCTTTSTLFR
jgi:hypothetical protein